MKDSTCLPHLFILVPDTTRVYLSRKVLARCLYYLGIGSIHACRCSSDSDGTVPASSLPYNLFRPKFSRPFSLFRPFCFVLSLSTLSSDLKATSVCR